jgi:hypothetical protein
MKQSTDEQGTVAGHPTLTGGSQASALMVTSHMLRSIPDGDVADGVLGYLTNS